MLTAAAPGASTAKPFTPTSGPGQAPLNVEVRHAELAQSRPHGEGWLLMRGPDGEAALQSPTPRPRPALGSAGAEAGRLHTSQAPSEKWGLNTSTGSGSFPEPGQPNGNASLA